MKVDEKIRRSALLAIENEIVSIQSMLKSVNDDFISVVKDIFNSEGRVIITGIGKSAIIANKIVATLNSTGTPSIFMHAADAIHGDLGIIQQNDIVIAISKSGETPEVKILAPLIKARGNMLVAMVGNLDSYLALRSDYILNTTVEREACPNNLAPTSSTTAQLVMGDALAISLLDLKGFTPSDFAKFHPGGALGKRMFVRVGDISIKNEVPVVEASESATKVIIEISSKRLGATAVLDSGALIGVITDGDIRRMIEKNPDFARLKAREIMSGNPRTIERDELVVNALSVMRENNITQLLVVDDGKYKGVIHLHDILNEGIF
ncbi:MAG: KpsF/GutQ family sugar-phosphate isomerase [Chlorobi bacterium]|nr:KpsF/GutQ family sugar-phosphate isomerase [Chlorobiota bacterium]